MAITATSFKIDGVTIPVPTEYTYSIEDLSSEETGRTLDGLMHKDVVATKDKYDCVWQNLSWADTATLMNAIDGKEKVTFTHPDPRVPNEFVTHEFYIGQRTGIAMNLKDPNRTWKTISFSFIRI